MRWLGVLVFALAAAGSPGWTLAVAVLAAVGLRAPRWRLGAPEGPPRAYLLASR